MVTFGSHVGNHHVQPFLSGVYAGVICFIYVIYMLYIYIWYIYICYIYMIYIYRDVIYMFYNYMLYIYVICYIYIITKYIYIYYTHIISYNIWIYIYIFIHICKPINISRISINNERWQRPALAGCQEAAGGGRRESGHWVSVTASRRGVAKCASLGDSAKIRPYYAMVCSINMNMELYIIISYCIQ